MPSVASRDRGERVRRQIHEVGPVATVDMDIHEARSEIPASEIDDRRTGGRRLIDRDDPLAFDGECPRGHDAVRQDQTRIREGHWHGAMIGRSRRTIIVSRWPFR